MTPKATEIIEEKLSQIIEQNEELSEEIDAIHKVLYGNGKPKGSVIDKLARFEVKIGIIFSLIIIIIGTIVRLAFF